MKTIQLTVAALAATCVLGCGTIFTPPDADYLALQSWLETYNITTGAHSVDTWSASISGLVTQNYPGSYGTVSSFGATQTDSQGHLYIPDARLDADWTMTFHSYPCMNQVLPPKYYQDGVYEFPTCIQTVTTLQASQYSELKDGTLVYTGGTDKLIPDESMYSDESRTSADGRFHFYYQNDGNLVLYDENWSPLWASNTGGTTTGRVIMQADGNLVIYNASNVAVWASNTSNNNGAFLVVQSDGVALIFTYDGSYIPWGTGTCCH